MNDKTKRVIAGWLLLNDSERAEFEQEIDRVRNAPSWQQRSIREDLGNVVTKVATGPYGQSCPCCGR